MLTKILTIKKVHEGHFNQINNGYSFFIKIYFLWKNIPFHVGLQCI